MELLELTEKVTYLGRTNQPYKILDLIKEEAKKQNMTFEDLGRRVANLAIELGHVQPIRQVENIDIYEGLNA